MSPRSTDYVTFKFAGQAFQAHPCGGLYWPAQDMVIVSDLHLEKGSHYARQKQFLPPYDTQDTLAKLSDLCERVNPKTVLFLGDVFHDRTALGRMHADDRAHLDHCLDNHEVIWVEGNHDEGHVPPQVTARTHITQAGVTFRHIASARGLSKSAYEISGHYHPAVTLRHKGARVRKPCVVYSGSRLIMPSYGVFTGGLDVTDEAISAVVDPPQGIIALGRKSYRLRVPQAAS